MLFFIPHDQHQDPPLALLWEIGLSLCTHSQPLCLSQPLQGASSSSGRLAFHPALALSLCFFTHIRSLRVWLLAPPSFSGGRFRVPLPTLLSVLRYGSLWAELCQFSISSCLSPMCYTKADFFIPESLKLLAEI
jgi:hypothetical protein